jgi:hypothetical protein
MRVRVRRSPWHLVVGIELFLIPVPAAAPDRERDGPFVFLLRRHFAHRRRLLLFAWPKKSSAKVSIFPHLSKDLRCLLEAD